MSRMQSKKQLPDSNEDCVSLHELVLVQFDCGTRILRVIHGRDARATFSNCTSAHELDQKASLDTTPTRGLTNRHANRLLEKRGGRSALSSV